MGDGEAPRIKSRGRKMAALSLKLRAREAYFTLRAKTDISPASRAGKGGERSGKNLKLERNAPPPGLCSKQIDKYEYTRDGK